MMAYVGVLSIAVIVAGHLTAARQDGRVHRVGEADDPDPAPRANASTGVVDGRGMGGAVLATLIAGDGGTFDPFATLTLTAKDRAA